MSSVQTYYGQKELGVHRLEKRRLKGDVIAPVKYLKGCHTEEGQDLFSIKPECKARNNGLKLQEARFWLNIRKNFLTIRAVQQWNNLYRDVECCGHHGTSNGTSETQRALGGGRQWLTHLIKQPQIQVCGHRLTREVVYTSLLQMQFCCMLLSTADPPSLDGNPSELQLTRS